MREKVFCFELLSTDDNNKARGCTCSWWLGSNFKLNAVWRVRLSSITQGPLILVGTRSSTAGKIMMNHAGTGSITTNVVPLRWWHFPGGRCHKFGKKNEKSIYVLHIWVGTMQKVWNCCKLSSVWKRITVISKKMALDQEPHDRRIWRLANPSRGFSLWSSNLHLNGFVIPLPCSSLTVWLRMNS